MNLRLKKILIIASLTASVVFGVWSWIGIEPVQAVDTGLNFATETGLSAVDPRVTIARIVRIALGFLGIIALGLIIYAGFVWMTAKGEEEKINQAKKIMISASIGLAIVLASFAITSFILGKLLSSTGGGGGTGGSCNPACASGQFCCNGSCQNTPCGTINGGEDIFKVSGTAPANDSVNVPRNAVVRFRFSKNVKPETVTASSFVVTAGSAIAGQLTTSNNYVEFVPEAACEAPNGSLKCFPKSTQITVQAKNGAAGIISVDDRELNCGGTALCTIVFTTGEAVDTEAPRVSISTQQICLSSDNTINASAIDDSGVSKIDFYVGTNLIYSAINNSNPFVGSPFNAAAQWNSNGYPSSTALLKATAYDLDTNTASATKDLTLAPAHCCNGVQDGDETGVDCGGSCISCEAYNRPIINQVTPAGGFCSNNPNKFCRKITEVRDCGANASCDLGTPNGAPGNFVSILGSGFGTSRGKVFFTGANNQMIEARLADDAAVGNPVCASGVWTNTQIIAVVPNGVQTGKVQIQTAGNVIEATDDEFGPLINNFKNNTIERPGICSLAPTSGKINDSVDYAGVKMSSSEAYFGNLSNNVKALLSSFPDNRQGTATVPNINTGNTTTFITKSDIESNYLAFAKDAEPYEGPIISSIDPLTGPVGQYVTIRGSGFGYPRGNSKVYFGDVTGYEADYTFPEVCSQSVWTDKQIIVKVPSGIPSGQNFKITVSRTGFAPVDSGTQQFNVTTGTPNPGLCRIQPSLARNNSEVSFWGEYFKDKDANSALRFYNNKNQTDTAITFWRIDEGSSGLRPWKAITTVPQAAVTGPVQVVAGSPAQLSNSLSFGIGQCAQDSDCGPTATCCAAGLPEAGKCKDTAAECYGTIATSVYEWQFSTGSQGACAPDQQRCGTVCCAGECDPQTPNKCLRCLSGQNECGDGQCCNQDCEGDPSHCPDPTSCSGYSYNLCLEGFYCPNSPGLCSPYPGNGQPIPVGQICGDQACANVPGCSSGPAGNNCRYDTALNKCVFSSAQICRKTEMKDANNQVIVANGNSVAGFCDTYSDNSRWHISNWPTSCPAGWTRLINNRCVDASGINGACSKCANPFTCQMSGNSGYCAATQTICPSGSTCDTTDNQCKKPDLGTCDCCCRKDNQNQDCCAGLSCEGSCGSGQSNLGLCSGCVVNGVPDDALCNCAGSTGKFCDDSENPRGVCKDCSSITDPAKCSEHAECCVDGKNGNRCTSVPVGGDRLEQNNLQYCAYYNCTNTYPNMCAENKPTINGTYNKLSICQQSCASAPIPCSTQDQCANPSCPANMRCDTKTCECKTDNPGPGQACRDPLTNACTGSCAAGYQCLLPGYPGGGTGPTGAETGIGGNGEDTCRCCCKPPQNGELDSCKQINSNLSCVPDKEPCTSNERGLCCGCSKDAQCGDVATAGCSTTDRCCRMRPVVTERTPAIDESGTCRNTLIEAVFDQKMNTASFADNVYLIGDYGTKPCPTGYPIVAMTTGEGFFNKLLLNLKKTAARIMPSLLLHPAFADTHSVCYVPGSAIATQADANRTKVSYRLTKALDQNTRYYMVLLGDPALVEINEEKDYYNENITSLYNVGFTGSARGRAPITFNTTTFKNSEIWSFTTGSDICALEKVRVTPSFQLFQRAGQEGTLSAQALDKSNRPVQPISGFYAWTWNFSSDNADVATVTQQGQEPLAIAKAGTKQDAQTLGRAKATITVDNANQPGTVGQSREGTGVLRIFMCENPWPVYYSDPPFPPGYQWPWQDNTTGIEFYYCRDKNNTGTNDDLPALLESPIVKQDGRKICMFGPSAGRTCTSDANCNNLSGSCLPEVLKEFFFFRENEPGIPNLEGEADSAGKKVNLRWQATPNASKYKIYYGLNPGQYTFTVDVPGGSGEITRSIDGLVNGLNYYFAVTALSNKNQESIFSNEKKIKPADTLAPSAPTLQVSAGDGKISLFWPKVTDAVSYVAYIGTQPRGTGEYPSSIIVRTTPPANTPNVIFAGFGGQPLNNATTYYVSVRAVDQYGNISDYAAEVAKRPNQPYLSKLSSGSQNSATATWLPFIGATGYKIYYGTEPGSTENSVTVSASTLERVVSGLQNNTLYYFTIKAVKINNQESDASNERSITVGGGNEGAAQ